MSQKLFTRDEVAKHKTAEDLWVIIDSSVYDLTAFAGMCMKMKENTNKRKS